MTADPNRDHPDAAEFRSQALLHWYRARLRDLPWRHTADPYSIWVSEIMLQQTQVATVVPYFKRFLDRFPTIQDLAAASEDEVLEHWAGLGYYSRGRNLRKAAALLVREHREVPATAEELRQLPGIGEYTAAAIGSIAFGETVPVIDGNVERVLCRFHAIPGDPRKGDARKAVRRHAATALYRPDPGDHNQAMMELGATVCTPRNPRCEECPVAPGCRARALDQAHEFPPVRTRRKSETQHWLATVIRTPTGYLVERSPRDAEFLADQWGVRLTRVTDPAATVPADAILARAETDTGVELTLLGEGSEVRHSITFRRLRVRPILLASSDSIVSPQHKTLTGIPGRGLASLHRKILASVASIGLAHRAGPS